MAIDGQSKSNLWAPSWDLTLWDLRVRCHWILRIRTRTCLRRTYLIIRLINLSKIYLDETISPGNNTWAADA